ncbi:ATP-binding protein [Asanoa sp. NPDC050611]|uniref:ATP-binding protein n=1 Tax=Asanoa sp. NPDC050611 TaxID=3157098 RepID=UPI0033D1A54B
MTQFDPTDPAVAGYTLLLKAAFDRATVAAVRHQVGAFARRCRMSMDSLDDFLVAVNEAMTNAVRHGGGTGQLLLWRDGALLCQIVDHGPGFDATPYLRPHRRPQPSPTGGMGLWLAQQASDDLRIHSDATGTTISISGSLGSSGEP